jgi:hypothetical protein
MEMITREMGRIPQRITTSVCEQFFAFVCQVEWGLPPAETAHLLGCKRLRDEAPAMDQGQANQIAEVQK